MCCPSSGAGRVICVGVAEKWIGQPIALVGPACGWTRSTTMPRASDCGCASASASEFTGPTGTPAAARRCVQSAFVRVAITALIAVASASTLAMRAVLVAKRGSSRHSGWPSTSAMRSQLAWLAPPMLTQPSLA